MSVCRLYIHRWRVQQVSLTRPHTKQHSVESRGHVVLPCSVPLPFLQSVSRSYTRNITAAAAAGPSSLFVAGPEVKAGELHVMIVLQGAVCKSTT